jgi:hypothetical protein
MTAAPCDEVKWLMTGVAPEDLTHDELASMIEILKAAQDRKQEPCPGVVYLDSARSRRRQRL